jgi:hypothetical protein
MRKVENLVELGGLRWGGESSLQVQNFCEPRGSCNTSKAQGPGSTSALLACWDWGACVHPPKVNCGQRVRRAVLLGRLC